MAKSYQGIGTCRDGQGRQNLRVREPLYEIQALSVGDLAITTHTAQKVQNEGGHLQCLGAATHIAILLGLGC